MRGGARAGAGAPKKKDKRESGVLIKFTRNELIILDIHAELKEMKRTEFIRFCIDEEIDRQGKINIF